MDHCFGSLQVCRLRVARLTAAGFMDPGVDSLYVTDQLIRLRYQLVLKEGANFRQENGCGVNCLTFQGDDEIESVTLGLDLCVLDAELIEMLTGATLVQVEGQTRGFVIPQPGSGLSQRVSIEAWTKAWDGDEQASPDWAGGNVLHHRFVFPSTSWVLGDGTLENNPLAVPVTGRGRSNSNFGDGPANDLPMGVYTSPMGHWIDDEELPDAECGYQELVAS